jgi:hypothetical protein
MLIFKETKRDIIYSFQYDKQKQVHFLNLIPLACLVCQQAVRLPG